MTHDQVTMFNEDNDIRVGDHVRLVTLESDRRHGNTSLENLFWGDLEGDELHVVVGVTPSFNADFDGDEMNVWGGFDIMAKAEMLAISDVKLHDTIHPVQDVITGAYDK